MPDMTLPTLNTKGVDVSNTLHNIYNMNQQATTNALQQRNIESEIANRNALQVYNAKKMAVDEAAKAKVEARAGLEDFSKATSWIAATPDPALKEQAYAKLIDTYTREGKAPATGFLPPDVFKTNGVWDDTKFNKWAKDTHYAITATLDPKEGTRVEHVILNPKFDANQPDSADNAKFIKVHAVVKDGKLTVNPDEPFTPTVDPFAKETREQTRLDLAERNTKVMEERLRVQELKGEKPEIKPMAALSKSRQIMALRDKIVNGGKIDPIMAMLANRPELANMDAGGVKDEASRTALLGSLETEYNEVQKFVDPKLRSPFTATTAKKTTMGDLYTKINIAGTSSKALTELRTMGYSEDQAKKIIKDGIAGGYVK